MIISFTEQRKVPVKTVNPPIISNFKLFDRIESLNELQRISFSKGMDVWAVEE